MQRQDFWRDPRAIWNARPKRRGGECTGMVTLGMARPSDDAAVSQMISWIMVTNTTYHNHKVGCKIPDAGGKADRGSRSALTPV